jgi:DNA processing protein
MTTPEDCHIAGSRERLAQLLSRPRVAIVGSRHCTYYGREVAERLSRDLAGAGITVLAGLTEGIEASAHHAVLATGGRTLAVVPGPPHIPYAAGQKHLHAQIMRRGYVVSDTQAQRSVQARDPLLERNRLIAQLAHVLILIEATAGAAATLTAETALELGREIGAVPGRIVDESAQGPNRLIRDGATPILDADDVLSLLAKTPPRIQIASDIHSAAPKQEHVHMPLPMSTTPHRIARPKATEAQKANGLDLGLRDVRLPDGKPA